MNGEWRGLLVVVSLASLMSVSMTPVQAVGLVTIQGQVTDPVGRVIVGAAVTDGRQTVYSDAGGRYRLEESSVQNYVVRVSRQGFESATRTVTPVDALGSVDFALFYLLASEVSPRAFNNVPPKTLTITARSYAPLDSCVNWTDAASSAVVALQLAQGVPGGQSTWTGSFAVPGGIPDASYAYSSAVTDCATATALSRTVVGAYIVDGAAPMLVMIAPLDGGNTRFTSQPIVAAAQDLSAGSLAETGSGVDPASVQVVVRDTAGQEPEQRPAAQMTGSGVIRSNSVALTRGKQYRADVNARDYAGNESSTSATFLVINDLFTTDAGQIDVTIDALAPTGVDPGGTLDPNDLYRWQFVPATVGAFSVTLRDSLHAGYGQVLITVPASQVSVTYTIAGLPAPPAAPQEQDFSLRVPFISATAGPVSAEVPAQKAYTLALTALVPKAADAGSVMLSLNGTAGRTDFAVCQDPTSADGGCAPDPMGVQTPIGQVPLGPCEGGENTGSVEPSDDGPAEVGDCVALGVPVQRITGGPPLDPGSDDAPPTQPAGPGRKYFGVAARFFDRTMSTYGLGGRLVVGDPDIRHDSGCTQENQDMLANRYMVKAVRDPKGKTGMEQFYWVEAGWLEYRHGPSDQQLYVAYNDASGFSGTLNTPFAQFDLRPGSSFFIKIERSNSLPYNWRVFLWWSNKWNELLNVPMPFSLATHDEVYSEVADQCHAGAFDPGVSSFGYSDGGSRGASSVKYTTTAWRPWNPANYPSVASGGPTSTNSTGWCDSTRTTACYKVAWLNQWFFHKFHKP